MSVCLRVMGGCWWQGELSHSTLRVRETHRDGWPLQLCWERVLTRSLLMKAVVWVGPYCWLRGYDLCIPPRGSTLKPRDTCPCQKAWPMGLWL